MAPVQLTDLQPLLGWLTESLKRSMSRLLIICGEGGLHSAASQRIPWQHMLSRPTC